MEKIISCCGLDCVKCDARIATMTNDDNLRKKTAESWQKMYNSPDITPEMIDCTGCMEEGVKIGHAGECQIRNCVISKGYRTCADCKELETCSIVSGIHKYSPEALQNLLSLRN